MDNIQLRRQISYWLDGALAADEVRALEKLLKASPAARREYLYLASAHAELSQSAERQELLVEFESADGTPLTTNATRRESVPARSTSRSNYWGVFAIAASLLLGVGLWRVMNTGTTGNPGRRNIAEHAGTADEPNGASILSAVKPLADDCRWYVERANREDAQSYRSGDVIRVSSGNLSLQYTNGTRVVLRSPAAYELISLSSARMIIGRLTATVAEAGKGFTIITPQADVIDLGTEFGVEVNDDGATDVVVFKGEVDLDYHDRETHAHRLRQRLRMGEAVRLDAVGTTSRLVWVNGESYSNSSVPAPARQPLIVEVRDNIERDSTMFSFYEIVAGGVKEDALAYVDRIAHEYNGITTKGMPSYLLNADYVKMFNSDKFNKTTHVEVTLNMPAKLYVLLDNRHVPPQWLTEGFRDTGDDIGLDNGPFQTINSDWHNKGPSGVGPGESVDDEMSIWVKEVTTPGVVHLGPMGTTVEVGANMYGIMATPLHSP